MPDSQVIFILQPKCALHKKKSQPMGSNAQSGCLSMPQPNGAGGSSWVGVFKGFRKQGVPRVLSWGPSAPPLLPISIGDREPMLAGTDMSRDHVTPPPIPQLVP